MSGVLPAFVPIWAVTAIGYLLSRFSVLGERAEHVLSRLAFTVAMPAVLFGTLIDTPFSALVNPGLIAFGAGTAVVGVSGFVVSWWFFRRKLGERVVSAAAACYVNTANLGIPVALQVLGSSTSVVTVLLFQSLLMMPAMLALLEADSPRGDGPRWRAMAMLPIRNPVIAASIAGVLVGTSGWHPPDMLLQPIHTLGNAGVATALLALGMSLRTDKDELPSGGTRRGETAAIVTLKVIVQPAVALGVGLLLDLPRPLLLAAVVCSALPTAQNIFIATSQYPIDTRFPRDCVVLSTLFSMVTLSGFAWLLA